MPGKDEETRCDEPRGGKLRTFLYICLVLVVLFAAWQAHLLFFSDFNVSEPDHPPIGTLRAGKQPTSTQPASVPTGDLLNPLGDLGLRMVEEDPGNFLPPKSAVRSRAFERNVQGERTVRAVYYLTGSLPETAEHYKQLAQDRNFKLARNSEDDDGVQTIWFFRDRSRLRVVLRKSPRNAKMVVISVIFTRPAERSDRS